MSVTKTYPRLKSTTTNSTGIAVTASSQEGGELSAHDHAGSDGVITTIFSADANESGSNDVQPLFEVVSEVILGTDGKVSVKVTVTPVKGDASDGSPQSQTFVHDQDMDAWQTAAGRARQA